MAFDVKYYYQFINKPCIPQQFLYLTKTKWIWIFPTSSLLVSLLLIRRGSWNVLWEACWYSLTFSALSVVIIPPLATDFAAIRLDDWNASQGKKLTQRYINPKRWILAHKSFMLQKSLCDVPLSCYLTNCIDSAARNTVSNEILTRQVDDSKVLWKYSKVQSLTNQATLF